MTHEEMQALLEELDRASSTTLSTKNSAYSQTFDALHNFTRGAEIAGCKSGEICWAYMTKHLVALHDKVVRNDFSDRDDFLEKCQDVINYIRLLWCIGNETLVDTED